MQSVIMNHQRIILMKELVVSKTFIQYIAGIKMHELCSVSILFWTKQHC